MRKRTEARVGGVDGGGGGGKHDTLPAQKRVELFQFHFSTVIFFFGVR